MMLDAMFLVDLARGDPAARALLEQAERGSEPVRVPSPAIARFWEGVERARTPLRDPQRVRELLEAAAPAPLDTAAALRAGRLLGVAAREGAPLDPFDALVAAIAIESGEALVTRSRELAALEGLRVLAY